MRPAEGRVGERAPNAKLQQAAFGAPLERGSRLEGVENLDSGGRGPDLSQVLVGQPAEERIGGLPPLSVVLRGLERTVQVLGHAGLPGHGGGDAGKGLLAPVDFLLRDVQLVGAGDALQAGDVVAEDLVFQFAFEKEAVEDGVLGAVLAESDDLQVLADEVFDREAAVGSLVALHFAEGVAVELLGDEDVFQGSVLDQFPANFEEASGQGPPSWGARRAGMGVSSLQTSWGALANATLNADLTAERRNPGPEFLNRYSVLLRGANQEGGLCGRAMPLQEGRPTSILRD